MRKLLSTVRRGVMFQYRSRSFLRNCSKANFVKTLVLLYSEKVSIIGTRLSAFPGEFNQGLQTKLYWKLDENSKKVKRKLNVHSHPHPRQESKYVSSIQFINERNFVIVFILQNEIGIRHFDELFDCRFVATAQPAPPVGGQSVLVPASVPPTAAIALLPPELSFVLPQLLPRSLFAIISTVVPELLPTTTTAPTAVLQTAASVAIRRT